MTIASPRAAALLLSLLAAVPSARAQLPAPVPAAAAHSAAPVIVAAPLTGSITLDGRLDDAAWLGAQPVTGMTQVNPLEGRPSSQPMAVRILYDEEAVYVGAMLYDTGPITLRVARRDSDLTTSDAFGVNFDSYHDHQTAFGFAVNVSGVQSDYVLDANGREDSSWNPVWDVAVAVNDSGWAAEMRIPFSQLRFRSGDVQRWGVQLERIIARNQEYAVHAFTPKNERGGPARYAHLDGIRGRANANRLELMPYLVGRADYRGVPMHPDVTFVNPYRDASDYGVGVGGDLKFRISSNITLAATINPDFGQVEADPAQINLSAFETRFDERRPFFVEGSDIFRFGSFMNRNVQMVYSRRVGRSPQGDAPPEAVYADVPEAATILGAAKVTGKTGGGWSFGMMEAVTGRETVPFIDAGRLEARAVVEPLSNYFAARARRSSDDGSARAGAIFTAVNRRLDDSPLASILRSAGYVAGADVQRDWGNRAWSASAELSTSLVRGSPGAMVRTQRSSARYFQRPDAAHVELDPARSSLAGYHTFLAVGRFAGDWQGNINAWATSPGYEINDHGFLTNADRRSLESELSYRENTPGRVLRQWSVSASPHVTWNHGGDRVNSGAELEVSGQLLNYWGGEIVARLMTAALDDRLTRGGPLARSPAAQSLRWDLSSNENRPLSVNVDGNHRRDAIGGYRNSVGFGVEWKPASNVQLRAGPGFERQREPMQYVTSVGDATATPTFGRRYVFATLDQTTLSIGLRANAAFTPRLTVETYVEPFLSSGDYGALKQLRAPRTHDFDVYGTDVGTIARDAEGVYAVDPDGTGAAQAFSVADRDYTYRSLLGSAVLRWEWRRGSALFLVWQQGRTLERTATGDFARDDRIGRFDPVREARGLFAIPPQNVLQLKVTYWLNP